MRDVPRAFAAKLEPASVGAGDATGGAPPAERDALGVKIRGEYCYLLQVMRGFVRAGARSARHGARDSTGLWKL